MDRVMQNGKVVPSGSVLDVFVISGDVNHYVMLVNADVNDVGMDSSVSIWVQDLVHHIGVIICDNDGVADWVIVGGNSYQVDNGGLRV